MSAAPFHAGEIALQQRAGVHERMATVGRQVIRDHMPDQHRELFEKLPTLLLATLDDAGQPWPTMLAGAPGFVRTPMTATLSHKLPFLLEVDDAARLMLEAIEHQKNTYTLPWQMSLLKHVMVNAPEWFIRRVSPPARTA